MNPLILVCGNSGTGKRTVSRFLEERLEGYHRFSPDSTRRKLGLACYDQKDTPEVEKKMYADVSDKLLNGGVIIHGHYKTCKERQQVYDFAESYSLPVLLIECHCPEYLAKQRISSRQPKDALHCPPNDTARSMTELKNSGKTRFTILKVTITPMFHGFHMILKTLMLAVS